MSDGVVVVTVAVVAHPTEKRGVAFEREHVAVRRAERFDEAPGRDAQQLRHVAGAGSERAELDELVQDLVAPPDLVEQGGVVERSSCHMGETFDELEVFAEVARHVVGQLEDADHRVARHERRRELGLVAPLLERLAAGGREHRVVEAGGQRDAALSDCDGAAGKVAQPDGGALPRAVEDPVVVTHQRAQRLAFDRIDVGDR